MMLQNVSSNVLFLQGPLGGFFARLARFLSCNGMVTYKINFNGGDRLYAYADQLDDFVGKPEEWSRYLESYLRDYDISQVFMYGDCRMYHRVAIEVANQLSVKIWVFEEGYLRPDYISLEADNVNAASRLPRAPSTILNDGSSKPQRDSSVGQTFFHKAFFALSYYFIFFLRQAQYPYYQHHRSGTQWFELCCWARSCYRKVKAYLFHRRKVAGFAEQHKNNFYFVPLQVHNDSQIHHHSKYQSNESFIEEVLVSFAACAPRDSAIVIKHHPMDRGFTHYANYIEDLIKELNLKKRVMYCHDAHLPTLLRQAKGTVTINSTVGLSSVIHLTPTKVMGQAIYDIEGLTSQLSLDEFWHSRCAVSETLMRKFYCYLRNKTQINGSFYKNVTGCFEEIYRLISPSSKEK
ncbi:capsular polysaccharide biosynthesis protein [Agarivorans sp. OAG1]|uniref:capsule biosynthesis protein n=1 Tax=Agarivorans sp. OAG1 TaxID=3082387 RepID=UPI002B2C56CF|nr:capsular polysaccharide biosynthesis protein [Agarivorans sp. OAG1]